MSALWVNFYTFVLRSLWPCWRSVGSHFRRWWLSRRSGDWKALVCIWGLCLEDSAVRRWMSLMIYWWWKISREGGLVRSIWELSPFPWHRSVKVQEYEKVSTDRMKRFVTRKSQGNNTILTSTSQIFKSNGLQKGKFFVYKINQDRFLCRQVLKFWYDKDCYKKEELHY